MKENNTDIEFLTTAFAYSFASMMEFFYLRKIDLKVIGVHLFDYSLISECKSGYETGLSKESERDIKEAIIANEKGYDTHILIPRLTKEQRFEIMETFIALNPRFKSKLIKNLEDLKEPVTDELFSLKKGVAGAEMSHLIHGIRNKKLKSNWTDFYRKKTKVIALDWLEKQKEIIHQE